MRLIDFSFLQKWLAAYLLVPLCGADRLVQNEKINKTHHLRVLLIRNKGPTQPVEYNVEPSLNDCFCSPKRSILTNN